MERMTEAAVVAAFVIAAAIYWLCFEGLSRLYAPSQAQAWRTIPELQRA